MYVSRQARLSAIQLSPIEILSMFDLLQEYVGPAQGLRKARVIPRITAN